MSAMGWTNGPMKALPCKLTTYQQPSHGLKKPQWISVKSSRIFMYFWDGPDRSTGARLVCEACWPRSLGPSGKPFLCHISGCQPNIPIRRDFSSECCKMRWGDFGCLLKGMVVLNYNLIGVLSPISKNCLPQRRGQLYAAMMAPDEIHHQIWTDSQVLKWSNFSALLVMLSFNPSFPNSNEPCILQLKTRFRDTCRKIESYPCYK